MISKRTIVVGIAMLLLYLPLRSEVITSISNNTLSVTSTSSGLSGFHGCDVLTAKKIPAYVFELQTQKTNKTNSANTCNTKSRWTTIAKKESSDKTITFENLPDGKYRVICLSGQAIGCILVGDTDEFPAKSIIYQKEISAPVRIGYDQRLPQTALSSIKADNSILKVFPNPATEEITIELQSTELQTEVSIALVDLLGQTVNIANHPLDKNSTNYSWQMNVQDYPPGAYFIRLQDQSGKQLSQKVIIQDNQ